MSQDAGQLDVIEANPHLLLALSRLNAMGDLQEKLAPCALGFFGGGRVELRKDEGNHIGATGTRGQVLPTLTSIPAPH